MPGYSEKRWPMGWCGRLHRHWPWPDGPEGVSRVGEAFALKLTSLMLSFSIYSRNDFNIFLFYWMATRSAVIRLQASITHRLQKCWSDVSANLVRNQLTQCRLDAEETVIHQTFTLIYPFGKQFHCLWIALKHKLRVIIWIFWTVLSCLFQSHMRVHVTSLSK